MLWRPRGFAARSGNRVLELRSGSCPYCYCGFRISSSLKDGFESKEIVGVEKRDDELFPVRMRLKDLHASGFYEIDVQRGVTLGKDFTFLLIQFYLLVFSEV